MTIHLSEELRSALRALSQSTGRSESELAREAIGEYLQQIAMTPSCYDLAVKAGWIGCFDSGIGDLSTNPQHMQGFGESARTEL